jgi:UDP-glucose 4,6-dehydratase
MPIIGCHHPRNFITKITNYEKICSIPNSMTVLDELLPIVLHMMKSTETGTYNMTNPDVIEHNDILEFYRKYVNSLFEWKNFNIIEQSKILKSERSNNYLNTEKLEKYCKDNNLDVLNIKDSIEKLLKNW